MDEFVLFLAGVAAGSVAILVTWGLFSLLSRLRNQKIEKVITSVEEKLTDVDSMVAAFHTGRITVDAIRNSLVEKTEAINRIYKPYIHRLDIYFVKYTEKRIEEYNHILSGIAGGTIPLPAAAPVISDIEERQLEGVTSEQIVEEAHAAAPSEQEGSPKQLEGVIAPIGTVAPSVTDEPVFQPEAPSSDEEGPVMSAIAEASRGEDELPLETFLEMETGTGTMAEPLLDEEKRPDEPGPVTPEQQPEAVSVLPSEGAVAIGSEEAVVAPLTDIRAVTEPLQEYPEETMADAPFAFSERISSAEPVVQPYRESGSQENQEPDETLAEAAIPFPERVSVEPEVELPRPPMQVPIEEPVIAARHPEPVLAAEEVTQPATIYDIEAETIIADRNELLGAHKPEPEPHVDKSSLGITGDDVSDMLDQFFGSKR